MNSLLHSVALFYHRLLRMHPAERGRDLWFQEEARAERLSNFIRLVYISVWLLSTSLHVSGNNPLANLTNVGIGAIWFIWALGNQIWLFVLPYRPFYKYVSTSVDMVVISTLIWCYQFVGGPEYAVKVPTFFTYFCCMGLAALRFHRTLAVFGGVLSVSLYALVFLYFNWRYPIEFGTGIEHTTTAKINAHYMVYQLVYLAMVGFLTYVIAVNVRRLLDLRARESEAVLRAKERAVVAAGVAHEIKNPLEGIYGAAQLLQEEGKGNPRFIEMILKDSVRLNETVVEFLRLSRPFIPKFEKTNVQALVRDFCSTQNVLTKENFVEFVEPSDLFSVKTDSEGICQILLNLVQNAKRFQPTGLPVQVSLNVSRDVAEIRVEDKGPGIDIEAQKKLFEPFFTTSTQGTGLGLAISRKIARELGGDLYYEALDPGSCFTLVVKNQPLSSE